MSRYTCHGCVTEHGTDNMVCYCASCFSSERTLRVQAEKERDEALNPKGASVPCPECNFAVNSLDVCADGICRSCCESRKEALKGMESLRAELTSTKDDLRIMTEMYHSNRRCQCSDEDCCAYEREKESLRAELAEAKKELSRHRLGESDAVRMVLERALKAETELTQAREALRVEKLHHQYDNQRKDFLLRAMGATEKMTDALVPSTPQEAEAWAKAQKDGKEK